MTFPAEIFEDNTTCSDDRVEDVGFPGACSSPYAFLGLEFMAKRRDLQTFES